MEGIQAGKNEIKLLLFTDEMTLHRKSQGIDTASSRTNSVFSKAAGYKLSVQKPGVFLCTSNEHKENKI